MVTGHGRLTSLNYRRSEEWQRLLEQLSEESERNVPLHIINEVPAEEGLYPPALSVKAGGEAALREEIFFFRNGEKEERPTGKEQIWKRLEEY